MWTPPPQLEVSIAILILVGSIGPMVLSVVMAYHKLLIRINEK